MLKKKLIRLTMFTGATTLAIGSCAGLGLSGGVGTAWLPWVVGAGLIAWLTQSGNLGA